MTKEQRQVFANTLKDKIVDDSFIDDVIIVIEDRLTYKLSTIDILEIKTKIFHIGAFITEMIK